tara:strand:+ start:234 stop:638 length:405 start_codon:yes stop_codon:yes gene_type:complete
MLGKQEAIVTVGTLDHVIIAPTTSQPHRIAELGLLLSRVKSVGADTQRQTREMSQAADRRLHAPSISCKVMKVHDPVQHQIAIGVKTSHQLLPMVIEIRLDLKAVPFPIEGSRIEQLPPEPTIENFDAPIGDLG